MQAIVLIGIQGTGKSTFFRERFFHTHIRINLDMLKTRHREDILLAACIAGKQRFVVDNTNASVQEREKYLRAARSAGFSVKGYYFESRAEDALRRNEQRDPSQVVPRVGVLSTLKRLEVPTVSEGFDSLYYVQIGGDGEFSVKEWQR